MTDMIPDQERKPREPMSTRNQFILMVGLITVMVVIARFLP